MGGCLLEVPLYCYGKGFVGKLPSKCPLYGGPLHTSSPAAHILEVLSLSASVHLKDLPHLQLVLSVRASVRLTNVLLHHPKRLILAMQGGQGAVQTVIVAVYGVIFLVSATQNLQGYLDVG